MKKVHRFSFLIILTFSLLSPIIIAPAAQASSDFQDVSKNHLYYQEISTLQQDEIVNTYENNLFKPTVNITRQDVAAWLNRAFDLKPIREGIAFNDVPKTSAYYQAIQAVYRAGIIDGNTARNFNPVDSLQRGQMAKVLVNTLGLELSQQRVQFSDTKSHWSAPYVQTLAESGITTGYDDGTFKPNGMVTRQHFAVFLYRVVEILKNEEIKDTPEKVDEKQIASYIIELVNEHRVKHSLPLLTENALLTTAAENRSMEIVKHFSHSRPNGTEYNTAVEEQNYKWRSVAENIAMFSSKSISREAAETLFNMWKNSPGHNNNMLSPYVEEIGVGIYVHNQRIYGVQLFGKN